MTQSLPTIASAVIIPDEAIDSQSPPSPNPKKQSPLPQSPLKSFAKRSPSEIAENESKRPRISDDTNGGREKSPKHEGDPSGNRVEHDHYDKAASPIREGTTNDMQASVNAASTSNDGEGNDEATTAGANDGSTTSAAVDNDRSAANGIKEDAVSATKEQGRRRNGQVEERKRSRRLFGALIGTLSQSSTKPTVAQRRRADIEQKQQTKLKMQAEELDQKRLKRLEVIMGVRRREQKKFDEQTIRTRHSNHLAMANFLHTRTEPRLYYKPWKLLPEESERIEAQIEDAEVLVSREEEEFYRLRAAEHDDTHMGGTENDDADDRKPSPRTQQDPVDDDVVDKATEAPTETPNRDTDTDQVTAMKEQEDKEDKEDKGNRDSDTNRKTNYDEEGKIAAEKPSEADPRNKPEDMAKTEVDRRTEKQERGEGPKDNSDDVGDEVLEAGEDTVIY